MYRFDLDLLYNMLCCSYIDVSMICYVIVLCYEYSWITLTFLYPRPTKLEGGYTGFTLSVCPSVRLSVCLSVDDMVSGA